MRSKKKTIKLCKKSFEWWIKWLGLLWWHVEVVYFTNKKAIKKNFRSKDVVMVCHANWMYMQATIFVNVPKAQTLEDDDVEATVVHELVHVLVNEMRAEGIDHEERVVTGLTKAFQWVRDSEE